MASKWIEWEQYSKVKYLQKDVGRARKWGLNYLEENRRELNQIGLVISWEDLYHWWYRWGANVELNWFPNLK